MTQFLPRPYMALTMFGDFATAGHLGAQMCLFHSPPHLAAHGVLDLHALQAPYLRHEGFVVGDCKPNLLARPQQTAHFSGLPLRGIPLPARERLWSAAPNFASGTSSFFLGGRGAIASILHRLVASTLNVLKPCLPTQQRDILQRQTQILKSQVQETNKRTCILCLRGSI